MQPWISAVAESSGAPPRLAAIVWAGLARGGCVRFPRGSGSYAKGNGLERGRNPRGWKFDVRHVPNSANRSHGSVLGIKLRRFCDGTRFRYVFY